MSNYELHLGDSLAIMRTELTKGVNHVITDPPYGTTNNEYEKHAVNWQEFFSVVPDAGNILMFAAQPFASTLIMTAPQLFRYDLIWSKSLPTGHLNARKMPLRNHEHILVFGHSTPTYNPQLRDKKTPTARGRRTRAGAYDDYDPDAAPTLTDPSVGYPYSIISAKVAYHLKEAGSHPSQKPTGLMRYLVQQYSNPGDTILDPFMGSGTTGVAALMEGRNFIGVELDPGFFAVAEQRIAAAAAQPRILF